MFYRILTLLLFVVFSPVALADVTAFVNVNILPMTSDAVVRGRTVIVEDGVITEIGIVDSTAVPDDATVIDGTDRYLMPGLAEMHGHVPGAENESLQRTLSLYVANGITTVRGMLGQRSHLQLKTDIESGEVLGPRLITSGPSFNGRSVTSTAAATGMVEAQVAAGYDFLKIHPGLTREEFDAMAAAANKLGVRFAGHVPEDVGLERALEVGIATVDHLDGYMQTLLVANDDPTGGVGGFFGVFAADLADEGKIPDIAAATAKAGVWNVPTQSLFEHVVAPDLDPGVMSDWPEMKYMPRSTVQRWAEAKRQLMAEANYSPETAVRAIDLRRALIDELNKAGAGLLLGSDSPQIFNVPGFAIHRELAFLVASGLTPYEALRTGTVNPATFFGVEDRLGTIQSGMVADLLLLDANPLDDIANTRRVHGVMVNGRWLSRYTLDGMLDELRRSTP